MDFYAGYFSPTEQFLSPGRYHLGTLPIAVLAGAPLLTFATTTALSPVYSTSFGSQCRGAGDADYTMRLGREWNNADGTFNTVLANVTGTVFLDANGTSSGNCAPDPGEAGMSGWPVTLNPGGLTVLTSYDGSYEFVNVPPGAYTLHLATPSTWNQTCPTRAGDRTLTVLPGQSYSDLDFAVKPGNLPPALSPIAKRTLVEGEVADIPLAATDPDVTPLSFSLVTGPPFASVQTVGSTAGVLHLAPQPGDAGVHGLTIAASDGTYDSRRSTAMEVQTPTGVASAQAPSERFTVSIQANPLTTAGSLTFRTSRPGPIRAILFDLSGRVVRTLMNHPMAPAGNYVLSIVGRDDRVGPLASGVYFFKVETVEGSQSGRAVVLK